MASLLVLGGSNFRGNFSMYERHPRRFAPDPPPGCLPHTLHNGSNGSSQGSFLGASLTVGGKPSTGFHGSSNLSYSHGSDSFRTLPNSNVGCSSYSDVGKYPVTQGCESRNLADESSSSYVPWSTKILRDVSNQMNHQATVGRMDHLTSRYGGAVVHTSKPSTSDHKTSRTVSSASYPHHRKNTNQEKLHGLPASSNRHHCVNRDFSACVSVVCPTDHQRSYRQPGELQPTSSMPDLRRETVVLSQHLPTKHDDRRRFRKSDPQGRRSDGAPSRRWGSRISLGNDKTNSFDLDDTDDIDSWSDTTEVIYPPSEPDSVDTYASTYKVFAVEGSNRQSGQKSKRVFAIGGDDVDSESTDPVSLEDQDEDDANDDTLITSTASTPSDERELMPPGTPDKELFVKENFESVSFTPVPMDKFSQQVATLERAAEIDPASMPFSPRLSLSSRFLSRSQFGGMRMAGGASSPQPDNWFDPLRKGKSEMARAMDETRRRLADMNWRTGGLIQESPEKEDPPSPPTKLDNKEPSYPPARVTQNAQGSPGVTSSPSPRTLRRFWADFTLPHQAIKEENPLPRIPVPQSLHHLKGDKGGTTNGSKIPLPSAPTARQATCSAELLPQSPTWSDCGVRPRPPMSPDLRSAQAHRLAQLSHDMKPVGLTTPPPASTPPQSPRLCRSRITSRPPRSPLSPDLRSPQSPRSPHSPVSPKPPPGPSSPRPPRSPHTSRTTRAPHSSDANAPNSPKPPRSPLSLRSSRAVSHSPDPKSARSPVPPKKPPRSLPPLKTGIASSRSCPQSPSSSAPPSPTPDGSRGVEASRQPPKKPPRIHKDRDKSPVPPSPTRRVPASSTHTTPASPTHGSSSLTARERRRSSSSSRQGEVNGTGNGTAPPVRQAPSYFRTTKSSRLKSASAGNLIKQAETQSRSNETKVESGAKKRLGKGRLSSSRLAMYASTPNLAGFQENDEETETEQTPAAPASNLRALADLSLSVPDINCLDDPTSTDSSSSSGHVPGDRKRSVQKVSTARSPGRLSLPPSNLLTTELHLAGDDQGSGLSLDNKDSHLMPPPATTNLPPRVTQSSLLRRAAQVRKRSTSELTLEQAKSILLGNSGILGANHTSPDDESPTSSPPGQSKLTDSTSSESSQRTLSSASSATVRPVSSRTRSASSHTNSTSSAVFEPDTVSGGDYPDSVYTPASTLAVAEEIERTATQLRRERERAAAAALGASRYDPPERDTSSRPKTPVRTGDVTSVTSGSGVVHLTLKDGKGKSVSPPDSANHSDEAPEVSVRDRIAQYSKTAPSRGSLDSGRSQSPLGMSPRSTTSTASPGVSSVTVASSGNQELMQTCTSVLADLRMATQRAKDLHSQIQSSGTTVESRQQMMSMMSETFHETHLTLAQLALQSPVSDNPKPPSCPLVGEGAGTVDTAVMDKARDMLQPFVSYLSRELSDELIKLIRDRLEGNPQ
ncbi:hypothetical protein BaRGS_00021600 [Batillaria attramentaria]|uniref:Uncharacterized protein n=1 Tax=Batillaria attramentaria TaxID=370345 RepID=A0ABD0KK03_9CAEN